MNREHYRDPTAETALRHIEREEQRARITEALEDVRRVLSLHGLTYSGKITLIDTSTRKVFRIGLAPRIVFKV